ncbi:tape measure protein [Dongia sp.]|uniref:tape measure protein n=1 Tax=Dongia sp. TaxID=1977262 RepID=UPI0035B432D3
MRVALVLTSDASGLKTGIREASGEVKRFSESVEQTARATGRARDAVGRFTAGAGAARASAAGIATAAGGAAREVDRLTGSTQRATGATTSMVSQLRSMVAAIGGVLVVRQIIQWADAWKLTEGRLSLVTKSTLELKAVQQQLFEVSQRTGQAFGSTATLYSRLAQSTTQLGVSQRQLLAITETINQAFVVSGAGAAEAQAAIVQLSQAIASGVLRGDEFNSVMEQAPRLSQALSDSLGKTRGELRTMAEQGQLTVQMILKALTEEAPKIGQEFAKMPLTVGRAMTQLGNSLQRLVGLADSASGSSAVIAEAIAGLARKLSEPQVVAAVANFAEVLTKGLTLAIDAAVAVSDHLELIGSAVAGLVAFNIAGWLNGAILGMRALALESLAFVATPFGAALVAIGLITAAVSYLWMENAEASRQEKALADAMKTTEDARRLSAAQVKNLTEMERQLTVEKLKDAAATQQQAVAELELRRVSQYADLAKAVKHNQDYQDLGIGARDTSNDADSPIRTARAEIAKIDEEIAGLKTTIMGTGETIWRILNGAPEVVGGSGSSSDTGLADKIKKARKEIEALQQTVIDLSAQKISLDKGGADGLSITQDAQKARDMLLSFGDAAKLGTDDLAALETAAGATVEQIANWLSEQRTLNDAIAENLDLLQKQADAPETFAKYIEDLKQQNAELKLEVSGRKNLIPLLQAEARLKADMGGKELTSDQRQQLTALLDEQNKLNAAIDRQKDITDAAKKSAEMMQEPFKNALRGIQQAWTDMFRKVLDGNMKSFKDFGRSLLGVFKQLAAEIATLLVFRPIVGGVLSNLGMGDLSNQLGLGSGNGGANTGGSGGSILSGSLSSGQWNTGIGSMLFGSAGTTLGALGKGGGGVSSQIAPGTATSGLFGTGGGQLSGALNSPIGGGIFSGLVAGATTYASGGNAAESIGAGVGGMVGGIAGSYFGPVGTMIGSTIGSIAGKMLGGLFGKKPKWKKQKSVAGAVLGFGDNGLLGVDSSFAYTKGKGMKADNQAGGKLGDAMSDAFNDFFLDIGAQFDPSAQAQVQEVYQAKVKGKKKKGEKHYFYGSFADQYIGTSETAEQFVPQFLSGSLAVAAEKGLVTGVSETILTIFKNVFKDNNNMGIQDSDELTRMVEFGKFYDRVDEVRTPAIAAADALTDLKKALSTAKSTAEEFGLSVDHVTEVFQANFLDQVDAELLQIKDPQAYALAELDKEYAARKAVAIELGVDLTKVEELYALKRKEVVEAGLNQMQDQFRDFFDELTLGDLAANNPTQKFAQAQGRFNDVVAANDNAHFVEAARDYLQVAQGYYGANAAYAKIYDQVLELTRKLGNIQGFANGGVASGISLVGERGPELINAGMPSMVINPRMAAELLNRYHRFDDTQLVHINDNEARMLARAGGSNTINPWTGLREFGYGSDTPGGRNEGAGGKPDKDKSDGGGDGHGGKAGGGDKDKGGGTKGPSTQDLAKAYKEYADSLKQAGMSNLSGPPGYGKSVHEWNERPWYEKLFDFVAGPFVDFERPTTTVPASYEDGTYHWSFDPMGVLGGILGGLAFPGGGILGSIGGSWVGDQLGIGNVYPGSLGSLGGSAGGTSGGTGSLSEHEGGGGLQGLLARVTSASMSTTSANDNKVSDINARLAAVLGLGSGTAGLTGGSSTTETLRLLTEIRDINAEGLDQLNATFAERFEELTSETRRDRIASQNSATHQSWSGKVAAGRK